MPRPAGWGDAKKVVARKEREMANLEKQQNAEIALTDMQKQEVRDQLLAAGMPSALAEQLISLAEGTRLRHGFCPNCRRSVKMDSPDSTGQLKAIQMALEYTLGKPVERREVDVTVSNVNSLSLSEKLQKLEELRQRRDELVRAELTSGD